MKRARCSLQNSAGACRGTLPCRGGTKVRKNRKNIPRPRWRRSRRAIPSIGRCTRGRRARSTRVCGSGGRGGAVRATGACCEFVLISIGVSYQFPSFRPIKSGFSRFLRGGRASSMGRSKAGKTFEQKAGFRGKRYGGHQVSDSDTRLRVRGQKRTSERQFYKRGPPADSSWLHATLFILFVVIFVAWILGY